MPEVAAGIWWRKARWTIRPSAASLACGNNKYANAKPQTTGSPTILQVFNSTHVLRMFA